MSLPRLVALPGLVALALCFVAPAARSEGLSTTASSHVLVGLTPGSGFELTCNDSLLCQEPVESDELGILDFTVDPSQLPDTGVICLRPPGPPQITDAGVCAAGDTLIVLCWSTDRPASTRLQYGDVSGVYTTTLPWSTGLDVTHEAPVSGLEPEATYYYRILAVDAFGSQSESSEFAFDTCPPRPAMLGEPVASTGSTWFSVAWSTTSPAEGRVEYGVGDTDGGTAYSDAGFATTHEVTVTGLTPETRYVLRLVSTDECGQAASSQDMYVTTSGDELRIVGVSVVDTSPTTALIRWWTTRPATSSLDYGATPAYGQTVELNGDPSSTHLALLEELEPETTYHFRAISRDSGGDVASTGDLTFTTADGDAPHHLDILNVSVSVSDGPRATVRWMTNVPATSRVDYGTGPDYGSYEFSDDLASTHTLVLAGLESQRVYHFRVSGTSGSGLTASSEDLTFSTHGVADMSPPLRPDGLVALPEHCAVELSWNTVAGSDVAGYTVYRREEGHLLYVVLGSTGTHETTWLDEEARPGVYHDYAVASRDAAGNESALSEPVRAMAGVGATGGMWVFPNPLVSTAEIRFVPPAGQQRAAAGGSASVRIYDSVGRLVRRLDSGSVGGGPRSLYWDATDDSGRRVASGAYFCVAGSGDAVVRSKILVLR